MDVTFKRTGERRYAVIVERRGERLLRRHGAELARSEQAARRIEHAARARRDIDGLSARWSALAIGEALTLAWPGARAPGGRRRG
jgi:hypothetical protein